MPKDDPNNARISKKKQTDVAQSLIDNVFSATNNFYSI